MITLTNNDTACGDDVDGGHTCDDNGEDDLRVALTNDDVSGNNACYLDGVE